MYLQYGRTSPVCLFTWVPNRIPYMGSSKFNYPYSGSKWVVLCIPSFLFLRPCMNSEFFFLVDSEMAQTEGAFEFVLFSILSLWLLIYLFLVVRVDIDAIRKIVGVLPAFTRPRKFFFLSFQQALFRYDTVTFFSNHDILLQLTVHITIPLYKSLLLVIKNLWNGISSTSILQSFFFTSSYIYILTILSVFVVHKIHWAQQ